MKRWVSLLIASTIAASSVAAIAGSAVAGGTMQLPGPVPTASATPTPPATEKSDTCYSVEPARPESFPAISSKNSDYVMLYAAYVRAYDRWADCRQLSIQFYNPTPKKKVLSYCSVTKALGGLASGAASLINGTNNPGQKNFASISSTFFTGLNAFNGTC